MNEDQEREIAVMQCPVAGFQFHAGETCWAALRKNDPLVLRREPGNRHDPRAIGVDWQGVRLGYVPREANYAVSQMLDRGDRVAARISGLRQSADPWQRIMMDVVWAPGQGRHCDVEGGGGGHGAASGTRAAKVLLLDPCVALDAVPKLDAGRVNEPQGAEKERLLRTLHEALPELARRLALAPRAMVKDGRRCVRLWDAIEISVSEEGRELGVRFLEPLPGLSAPTLSADLRSPVGPTRWVEALVHCVADACRRNGVKRIDRYSPAGAWLGSSLRRTFRNFVNWVELRRSVLAFLAPEPLGRSLANRIFNDPSADAFNWVCEREAAIALVAVEHPAMLPFLRVAHEDDEMRRAGDPLAELQRGLLGRGLEPGAWKRLERWTFEPFARLEGQVPAEHAVVQFANLLHRLDVKRAPSMLFTHLAFEAGVQGDPATLDFERHPDWFLRALLREAGQCEGDDRADSLRDEVRMAIDWLDGDHPDPDANQRRAGWSWIAARAREHAAEREKARLAPWKVPLGEIRAGGHLVVPIACAAELAKEAQAMKNCLADYEDECARGEMLVFSVRDAQSGKRLACFSTVRDEESDAWALQQLAGKLNAPVGPQMELVAAHVLELLGA